MPVERKNPAAGRIFGTVKRTGEHKMGDCVHLDTPRTHPFSGIRGPGLPAALSERLLRTPLPRFRQQRHWTSACPRREPGAGTYSRKDSTNMAEGNGRQWSGDIKQIGDSIAALTVSKAVELGDYLEEVHKIKPAAGGVVMAAGPGGPAAAAPEKPAEKTEFTVQLDSFGADKIKVIKVVREITGL